MIKVNMKFIEKVSLTLFSVLILVLSLVLSLILFNWLEVSDIYYGIQYIKSVPTATNISLVGALVTEVILTFVFIYTMEMILHKKQV